METQKLFSINEIEKELLEQIEEETPKLIIESMVNLILTMRTARNSINDDGLMVKNGKNDPIPHPAIKIEQDAQSKLAMFLAAHRK
jgi:hypothetical protein